MRKLLAVVKKIAETGPTTAKKKPAPRERTGPYWPDDDLAELEANHRTGWIDRKRVKDWLRRRR